MASNRLLVVLLVIALAFASDQHLLAKRDAQDTNRVTTFLSDTWESLRNQLTSNSSQTHIRQFASNLNNIRQNVVNAGSGAAEEMMTRLQNLTQRLNNVLRERANNDRTLVNRLYKMINGTHETDQPVDTLRQAFTTATRTMAENYSGLANSSIQLASDLMNKSRDMFKAAMIRAGNDTNRAVVAANTAIDALKNSSQPIDDGLKQIAANLANSAQRLSAGLRNLMNRTSGAVESGVQTMNSDEYRRRAEQSLGKLKNNMDQLRNSLSQFASGTVQSVQDNVEDNEIVGTVSQALRKEMDALQNQIAQLRRQSSTSSN